MMRYFELTDSLRRGEIIREDGRKHYRFSFGTFQWERTTVFQAYITEGTPLYGQFRQIPEQDAQPLLMQHGKVLSQQLQKAEAIAKDAHASHTDKAGKPYIDHIQEVVEGLTDWEEQTAAWLHEIGSCPQWTVSRLREAGIGEKICRSVQLLTGQPNEAYSVYLRKLRMDRIARRVKIADVTYYIESAREETMSEEEKAQIEQYRQIRKYLFGDIPVLPDGVGPQPGDAPRVGVVPAMQVYQKIRPAVYEGRKIPHGVSNPVLRREDGKLYLAFFAYSYTREQLKNGFVGRPTRWVLADIESGQLIRAVSCAERDFTTAGKEERFSVENPNRPGDPDHLKHTYTILDEVRRKYLQNGKLDASRYEEYLNRLLLAVPPSYHRFYRELSSP